MSRVLIQGSHSNHIALALPGPSCGRWAYWNGLSLTRSHSQRPGHQVLTHYFWRLSWDTWERGGSPAQHRANIQTQTITLTFTPETNLESHKPLNVCLWTVGGSWSRTHRDTGATCKLHTNKPPDSPRRFRAGAFLLCAWTTAAFQCPWNFGDARGTAHLHGNHIITLLLSSWCVLFG